MPLGTEFKVAADFSTGILLHLEVMEGGAAMSKKNMSLKIMEVLLQQPPVSVREHDYLDNKKLIPVSMKTQVKRQTYIMVMLGLDQLQQPYLFPKKDFILLDKLKRTHLNIQNNS